MSDTSATSLLKAILSNLNSPQELDNHPWAVAAQVDGAQLVAMTLAAFRRMIPPSAPHTGKRLDTRWGIFGILAAQYFAPYVLRAPPPASLRDSWDGIDRAILLFVQWDDGELTEREKDPYRFAEKERMPAPNSTLSDWHRHGMEVLAGLVQAECMREQPAEKRSLITRSALGKAALVVISILLICTALLGWKAWGLYQRALVIEQKADSLRLSISPETGLEQAPEIAEQVHDLRGEIEALQSEAAPYLWLTKYCGWIPKYGGVLQQAEDLLILAQSLAAAADDGFTAIAPAVDAALDNDRPMEILDLLVELNDSSPKLLSAQIALARAQEARRRINPDVLPARLKDLITQQLDPLLNSVSGAFPIEDALTLVRAAPGLLGSGQAGPQTYLILMQNEDELRPTGGFLTAVGLAVVKDGKLLNIKIESSDRVDDLSKPYPVPPAQFEQFMNIRMFLLRDSNWFTNFPTTVSWAEYFYSYSRGASADGVIALDMNVIVEILKVTGPVRVASVEVPISSGNVLEYMRSAKEAPPKGVDQNTWDRKQFIADLAKPILEKVLRARGRTWRELAPALLNLLDEKHILLQFDNEEVTALLAKEGWDGAVRIPEQGDYLMVVDANMGYNKSNAVMETEIDYRVDLSRLDQPRSTVQVKQSNLATLEIPCEPLATARFFPGEIQPGEIPDPLYNIEECHWGYIRLYLPEGTRLLGANPQEIPETAAMLGQTIPARTDDLGSEDIPNAQVFGTMTLTPTNSTTLSKFEFALPARVISGDQASGTHTYTLKVQKQPGTLNHALVFHLRLPEDQQVISSNIPLTQDGGGWSANLNLLKDVWIEVQFGPK